MSTLCITTDRAQMSGLDLASIPDRIQIGAGMYRFVRSTGAIVYEGATTTGSAKSLSLFCFRDDDDSPCMSVPVVELESVYQDTQSASSTTTSCLRASDE
jgi:hypothetical protein